MGRMGTAFRMFFGILFQRELAERAQSILASRALPPQSPSENSADTPQTSQSPATPKPPSEALLLMAALQREGRLLDFLKEDLSGYDDSQVGAAVRDIHRDCGRVIDRMLGIEPVFDQNEGDEIELAANYDPLMCRLTGKVPAAGPFRGVLRHHGWRAARCEIPAWTGPSSAARIVAPAEVEAC